eukprot:12419_1
MKLYPFFSYAKVFVLGVVSVTLISSLYSYLANVESVQMRPDKMYKARIDMGDYQVIKGISCTKPSSNTMWSGVEASSTCNSMAVQIANLSFNSTTIPLNPSWDCTVNVEFKANPFWAIFTNSGHSFTSTFSSVRLYIWAVILFAILYGLFVIIHDATLIYNAKQLKKVTFYPQTEDEYRLRKLFVDTCRRVEHTLESFTTNGFFRCFFAVISPIAMLIAYVVRLALVTLDITYMMVFYPIKSLVHRPLHAINGFSYVSAAWTGLARTLMVNATLFLLVKSSYGFTTDITSLDPDVCRCQCEYVLRSTDFWVLMFVSVVFCVVNLPFLKSWVSETVHDQHYLYLISYKLSFHHAYAINSKDPTGSMMQEPEQTAIALHPINTVNSADASVMPTSPNDQDEEHVNYSVTSWRFRVLLVAGTMMYFVTFLFLVLIEIARQNFYNYSNGLVICIYVSSGCLLIVSMIAAGKYIMVWVNKNAGLKPSGSGS